MLWKNLDGGMGQFGLWYGPQLKLFFNGPIRFKSGSLPAAKQADHLQGSALRPAIVARCFIFKQQEEAAPSEELVDSDRVPL